MKRLTISRAGYLRYMQMSTTSLFGFVEGKSVDRYFYGKLCAETCRGCSIAFQLITAAELRGAGGKQSLLSFHTFLARTNKLISDFKGKRTGALFFLDKDIDDIRNLQVHCDHIIYTPTYDVEGAIVRHGRLSDSIAATAGLDEQETAELIGSQSEWRRRCAETWIDWITICVFCGMHAVKSIPGYRVSSPLNNPANAAADPRELTRYLDKIAALAAVPRLQFDAELAIVRQRVLDLFGQNKHELIFKGKWYLSFITAELRAKAATREVDFKSLHAGFFGALSTTVDFSGEWALHWKSKVVFIGSQLR